MCVRVYAQRKNIKKVVVAGTVVDKDGGEHVFGFEDFTYTCDGV